MTPGVVMTGITSASLVIVTVAGLVAYLSVRGVDAGPLVQLATAVLAAVGSLGTLVLQLVGRKTAAKVEQSTGRLAAAVADQLVEVRPGTQPRPAVAHNRPPEPPTNPAGDWSPTGRHHHTPDSATAPGRQGE